MKNETEAAADPLYAQLAFRKGSYEHALHCYHDVRFWILENGLAYASDIAGIIYHPVHPQSPAGEKVVPMELVEQDGWQVTCDFWCDDQAALDRLLKLDLPPETELLDEEERAFQR